VLFCSVLCSRLEFHCAAAASPHGCLGAPLLLRIAGCLRVPGVPGVPCGTGIVRPQLLPRMRGCGRATFTLTAVRTARTMRTVSTPSSIV
jgi:hypothetical protein